MWPDMVSVARIDASSIALACVATTTRCRLVASATTPPIGASRKTGIWLANPTRPSSIVEPVSEYTSHDCATDCIHVPISEMSWPPKKSRKLRCLSARMDGSRGARGIE
jgi:hypothetical protein